MRNKKASSTIHVIHMVPLRFGGITSYFLNLSEELKDEDIVFDCLTFRDREEPNEKKALQYGGKKYVVPMDRYKSPMIRGLYKFFKTITVLRTSKADIIHIHASFPYDIVVGISGKLAGIPTVIFHSHNSDMPECSVVKKCVMEVCRKLIPLVSDVNLACSGLAAKFMYQGKIYENHDYQVLCNGIPTEKYFFSEKTREAYRAELKLNGKWVIGHVGRFTAQKNHVFLLEIFREIHKSESDTVLLLIGSGELESEIKQQAADMGLKQSVIFYGATDHVEDVLQAMDCFVMPSLYEGLPVSLLEAQASGLPIVLSDTISREGDVTGNLKFVSLSSPVQLWVQAVLAFRELSWDRNQQSKKFQNSLYDVSETAVQLMKIYMRKIAE